MDKTGNVEPAYLSAIFIPTEHFHQALLISPAAKRHDVTAPGSSENSHLVRINGWLGNEKFFLDFLDRFALNKSPHYLPLAPGQKRNLHQVTTFGADGHAGGDSFTAVRH